MIQLAKRLASGCIIVLGAIIISHPARAGDVCPRVGFTVVEPHPTAETRALKIDRHRTLYVHRDPLTTTQGITEIKSIHPHDGDPDDVSILVKFAPDIEKRLIDATTDHSGIRLAFLFEDEVMLNIEWQGRYGMYPGGTQLSIPHGMRKVKRLMEAIRGCVPIVDDATKP